MIRPATPEDVEGLEAAVIAAYAPYAERGLGLPAVAEGLAGDIRENHVWVAEDRGLILGGIVLVLRGGAAHIANLAVHPIGEGQGLGRRLIDMATHAAQEAGHSLVVLSTHKDMSGTQAFYERLGWIETGRSADKVTYSLDLI